MKEKHSKNNEQRKYPKSHMDGTMVLTFFLIVIIAGCAMMKEFL